MTIVKGFEMVDVDHYERQRAIVTAGPADFFQDPFIEIPPIEKACHPVANGKSQQSLHSKDHCCAEYGCSEHQHEAGNVNAPIEVTVGKGGKLWRVEVPHPRGARNDERVLSDCREAGQHTDAHIVPQASNSNGKKIRFESYLAINGSMRAIEKDEDE